MCELEGAARHGRSPVLGKSTGELAYASENKEKVWAAYLGGLAVDKAEDFNNGVHWQKLMPEKNMSLTHKSCDDPLTWEEVAEALRDLKRGKAPGIDLVPAELFKLM